MKTFWSILLPALCALMFIYGMCHVAQWIHEAEHPTQDVAETNP